MAGVKLAAFHATTGGTTGATVPADESWLVYTISVMNQGQASGEPFVLYNDFNQGDSFLLATTIVDAAGNSGAWLCPSIVMNAGDSLTVTSGAGGGQDCDVYVSGLVQRGPGFVPS